MDAILPTLQNLSLNDLQVLEQAIKIHISAKQEQRKIELIKDQVKHNGYHCDTNKFNISELNVLTLPLYINVYTCDCEDIHKNSCHVAGLSSNQKSWATRLGFKYEPTDDDTWELSFDNKDWHDPILSQGRMNVYVYYNKVPCPPDGSKFESIDYEGNLNHFEIQNGKILSNGLVFGDTRNWNDYDILVLDLNSE